MTKQRDLLVLVGPTAVGKTELSLQLAERFSCEIISADSMQVYRGMDIGTAKASIEERERIPHHLIDIVQPDEPFTVTDFQMHAEKKIEDISARGRLPFLVGGTGLYVQSVTYGYDFSEGGADEEFRNRLQKVATEQGGEVLLEQLKKIDPESAARIHPNNHRRLIRALEIHRLTGKTMTEHLAEQKLESPYRTYIIGLTRDRKQLYDRVNLRVDQMIQEGLVEEVERLLHQGYSEALASMQGLGYKEMVSYINGKTSLEVALDQLKQNTRRYAKRQLTWFRRMTEIEWFDLTDSSVYNIQLEAIEKRIEGKFKQVGEYNSDNVII
jgi:tRNA dimethylallyltransferase